MAKKNETFYGKLNGMLNMDGTADYDNKKEKKIILRGKTPQEIERKV